MVKCRQTFEKDFCNAEIFWFVELSPKQDLSIIFNYLKTVLNKHFCAEIMFVWFFIRSNERGLNRVLMQINLKKEMDRNG